jgi:hypothetical protein
MPNYGGIRPAMHPGGRRPPSPGSNATGLWRGLAEALAKADCSSLKYAQYSRSSRLARRAPRRPRRVAVIRKGSTWEPMNELDHEQLDVYVAAIDVVA